MKISATIITFNEEANIREACESVSWADEVIVIDSDSTDRTREIARDCGATVLLNSWPGFAKQKQYAVDHSQHEWILSIDADERVSDELRTLVQGLRQVEPGSLADGYFMSRRSFYQGRWIRGGGWYPDRQLRLFKKSKGHWKNRLIHESVEMAPASKVDTLNGDLLHYSVRDAAHHHRMIGERYAPLAAQQMFDEGKRTSPVRIAVAAPSAFIRSLILKGGFRDGLAGLSIATFAAHHAFLKHVMLWEMQQKK